jgi:hypothetical protein
LHAVIRELAGALNIFTDAMLIQKAESLHTFAPFNPNRAAVEGGAVAVWLLAPKSRPERIRRRLVLATQNARDIDSALTLRQLALATISRPRPHAARTGLPFELRIFVAEWSISSSSRDPRTAHDLSASQSDLRAANRSR